MEQARFAELLRKLPSNQVEFVVVEMMAGVLRGAPVLTLDLDLVHRRTPENVKRLLQVLVRRRERANECAIDWAACLSR